MEILINHFFAILKVSRPEIFETRKNESRDSSRDRDQVLRLHHWQRWSESLFLLLLLFLRKWLQLPLLLRSSLETYTPIPVYTPKAWK